MRQISNVELNYVLNIEQAAHPGSTFSKNHGNAMKPGFQLTPLFGCPWNIKRSNIQYNFMH
jgi:hypothetical protein